ncbi:DUF5652 family protein [Clostridium psychrophilum]|uniref:DUF5652 family protein n=1 Tax=Clostridium psychrophilum TaxID=132926 RepID=UPI001C0C622D|nr:DUF5652 family protein [Clostridium psychrophilum]MBU3182752.1 hypothetical protein [Clostridium psychrophilum]
MNNIMHVLNPNSPILYLLIAWSVVWKGIALWHSARNKQLIWYITLLIVNTVGILEIIYLVFFKKKEISFINCSPTKIGNKRPLKN